MTVFINICDYLKISPSDFFAEEKNNPKKLNEMMTELNKLDDTALDHLLGIAKELNKGKK